MFKLAGLGSAFLLALGTLAPPAVGAEPATRSISVSGVAERRLQPDMAYLDFGVQVRKPNADDARREVNRRIQAILAVIMELRIDSADVDSTSINVNPEFVWNQSAGERRLQGYLVERRVRVRLTQLDKLGPLLERSMRAGANQIAPPRFDHSRKDALRREVMTEATRDANRNAEAAAAGVGMKPGRALQIQVLDDDAIGIMAPRVMMRAAAVEDGAAEESYQPSEFGFKVKVTATFELVP
jgi:uncharacterized protein YggE